MIFLRREDVSRIYFIPLKRKKKFLYGYVVTDVFLSHGQLDAIESIYPTEVQFDQGARRFLCEAVKKKKRGEGTSSNLYSHRLILKFLGIVQIFSCI